MEITWHSVHALWIPRPQLALHALHWLHFISHGWLLQGKDRKFLPAKYCKNGSLFHRYLKQIFIAFLDVLRTLSRKISDGPQHPPPKITYCSFGVSVIP